MHPHPHGKITPPVTVVLSHIKVRPLNFKRFKDKFSFRGRVGVLYQYKHCLSSQVKCVGLNSQNDNCHLIKSLAWCMCLSFDTIFPSVLFIDQEPTTWPANKLLQISVFLQMILWSCVIGTALLCENCRSVPRAVKEWFDIFSWSKDQWSNEKIIIELGYPKISCFVRHIICQLSAPAFGLGE